jgi:hypothetical protein
MRFLLVICEGLYDGAVLLGDGFGLGGSQLRQFHFVLLVGGHSHLPHHVGECLSRFHPNGLQELVPGPDLAPEFAFLLVVLLGPLQVLVVVVDSEDVAPHKGKPGLLVVVVVGPDVEVDEVDDGSLDDESADCLPDEHLVAGGELVVHEDEDEQHYFDDADDQQVVDVDLVVVLPVLDAEEGPADADVQHVAQVDQDQEDYLHHWVAKRHRQENSSQQLVHVAHKGLRDLPRPRLRLDWIGEDEHLVDPGLAGVGEVDLVGLVGEAVVLVLDEDGLLKEDEVVGLLDHQVDVRMLLDGHAQAVGHVDDGHEHAQHEEEAAEDGEALDGVSAQVGVELHVEDAEHEDGEEEDGQQAVHVLLPESLPDELLAPFLELLIWELLAANEDESEQCH